MTKIDKIVLIVILIFGSIAFANVFLNKTAVVEEEEIIDEVLDEEEQVEEPESFSYEYLIYPEDPDADKRIKGSIIRTNDETGETEVLVQDITKAYNIEEPYTTLWELVIPEEGDKLYFTQVLLDSDAPLKDIIEYDAIADKFTKLEVSKYWQGFGPRVVSDNSAYVVSGYNPNDEDDTRSLYLLDLEADTAKLVTKLGQNETFNACFENNCLGGYIGEAEWLDANTYVVNVYDPNQTETINGYTQHKLIEQREFNI